MSRRAYLARRLDRYHLIRDFGHQPTAVRRVVAALIAGALALGLAQALLVAAFDLTWREMLFPAAASAFAAALAAFTLKPVRAAIYGVLAVLWLLFEMVAVLIGVIATCLG